MKTYTADLLDLEPDELKEYLSELSAAERQSFHALYTAFITSSTDAEQKKGIKDKIYDLLGLVTDEELDSVLQTGEMNLSP